MNKKVSVIIPTYKRSEFLQRAIESVLNQTYANIEIIIVDDNDPDQSYRFDTEKIMKEYHDNNKVKYIKTKQNLGGALARNEGVFRAEGDFITFLDDDDIYLPKKVEVQVAFMLKKNLDLSFTDVRFHNIDDLLVDYREHCYIKHTSNTELLKHHLMHHLTPTATYMFKREAIVTIGAFDDVKMGQEFMLMLKAIERGLKIGYMKGAYVIQYLHDEERISIGQNKISKEVELFHFKKKYFKYLTLRQRQYVKFRHHTVMMVAGKRSGEYHIAFKQLLRAIFTSPFDCIKEFLDHRRKIKKYKKF
ncbi:glycosyltransferase family 2 protein [Alkalibacillus silvisoli]|uniref:Glycosyltransferase 2-like domain-containing protein n=1 Tax=Alkalibacillus silvisoli TaxID=392823 RepID=A0ABP3K1H8_9BACI